MMTVNEVASKYKVDQRTVRRWISDYGLPSIKIGGAVRIEPEALEEWRKKREEAK